MSIELKPIDEQVIVITGASSGIGLATARLAVKRGASIVLAARSKKTLDEIVAEFDNTDSQAIAIACDVSDGEQVKSVADAAVSKFGRIDTWVNNAGLGMYGRLDETLTCDARRLFDVNFWGVVNGSLAAIPHLKKNGGALINVGSEVSEAVVPLLGMYSATKHAVKGFTDALRIEIEEVDQARVSITLIQPTAVNTPFPQHSKNYMSQEPKLPTPMIEPDKVAEAILDAAVKPTRATKVGLMATLNTAMANMIPSLADRFAAKQVDRMQYDELPRHPDGALYESSEAIHVAGRTHGTGGVEVKA